MATRKTKISPVKIRPDYAGTLKGIPVGETRSFEMLGDMVQTMRNAKWRLAAKGFTFDFEAEYETNLLHITRIS